MAFCSALYSVRFCSSRLSPLISERSLATGHHAAWYKESLEHPEEFWGRLARERLRWMKPFTNVMDCSMKDGHFRWFEGGKLNMSGNSSDSTIYKCIVFEKQKLLFVKCSLVLLC